MFYTHQSCAESVCCSRVVARSQTVLKDFERGKKGEEKKSAHQRQVSVNVHTCECKLMVKKCSNQALVRIRTHQNGCKPKFCRIFQSLMTKQWYF